MHTIIHVITRLDMGGSAQNTLQTCRGTADRYRILLAHGLSEESAMTDSERESVRQQTSLAQGCGVIFKPLSSLVRRISPWRDLTALVLLWWLFVRERPAIVHTHTSKAGIVGRLAAWLARVPIIIHTPHGHVFYGHFGSRTAKIYLIIEKLFCQITDYLVALTNGERNDYLRLGVGTAERLILIHSGVELEDFYQAGGAEDKWDTKQKLGLTKREKIVGTTGWLLPIKGPLILLEAMAIVWQRHPDAELVYVGKGDLEQEIRERAKAMGHANQVKLLGWRPDVPALMGLFDCFVLPSLNEGMGRVLVEAMAANCPVVASNTGGIPDLVTDEVNGLLVPPSDEAALGAAILRILDDPLLADRLRAQGLEVCPRYTLTAMLDKLHHLYAETLNSHQTPARKRAIKTKQ